MERKVVMADPEKCTGCRTCELACSFKHTGVFSPSLSRIRIGKVEDKGIHLQQACLDCTDQFCMGVCPTDACTLDDGVIEDECIGCQACITACERNSMRYNPTTDTTFKCDQCGGDPECVKVCVPGALTYGTLPAQADRDRLASMRALYETEIEKAKSS